MSVRSSSAALLVAAALVLAPAAAALAADTPAAGTTGATKSQLAKARAEARKLERQAKAKGRVVLGGTVKAVDRRRRSGRGHRRRAGRRGRARPR